MKEILYLIMVLLIGAILILSPIMYTSIVQQNPDGHCVAVISANGTEGDCGMLPDRYVIEYVSYDYEKQAVKKGWSE